MGRLGYKHTPEARAKISQAGRVRIRRKETYEKTVATRTKNGSYKHTDESKLKMSKTRKGVPKSMEFRKKVSESTRGRKSHCWRGGVSPIYEQIRKCFEYRLWRSDVFKRDNYCCQSCGDKRGGNLEADHIKPFILILKQYNLITFDQALLCLELWDINNGRTLCIDCHKKTDTYGTRAKLRT